MAGDAENPNQRNSKPSLHVRIQSTAPQNDRGVFANGTELNTSTFTEPSPGESVRVGSAKEKTSDGSELPTRDSSKAQLSFSLKLPQKLQWISANWSWSKWKPALRGALAAWISLVIFVIPTTGNVMGQVYQLLCVGSCQLTNWIPQAAFLIVIGNEQLHFSLCMLIT